MGIVFDQVFQRLQGSWKQIKATSFLTSDLQASLSDLTFKVFRPSVTSFSITDAMMVGRSVIRATELHETQNCYCRAMLSVMLDLTASQQASQVLTVGVKIFRSHNRLWRFDDLCLQINMRHSIEQYSQNHTGVVIQDISAVAIGCGRGFSK